MIYQPKEHALCKKCPLFQKGIPVLDLLPLTPDDFCGLSVMAEGPGSEEVKKHRPLIGPTGAVLWPTLAAHLPYPEKHVHATNCVRCGLPNGAKPTDGEMKRAIECCMPAVLENFRTLGAKCVISVGAIPHEAITGLKGIDKYRGTVHPPTKEHPYYITSTLHPAGLLRIEGRRILWNLLHADLGKAVKLANGSMDLWVPDVRDGLEFDQVIEFLKRVRDLKVPLAVDVETTIDDEDVYNLALQSKLATIGVSAFDGGDVPVCFSLLWPEAYPKYYRTQGAKSSWRKIRKLLVEIFETPEHKVVFHNAPFDVPVLQNHFKIGFNADIHDTLLLHHAILPKLPKKLQQVASQYLPVEPWKDDFRVFENELNRLESKAERELERMLHNPITEDDEQDIEDSDAVRVIRKRIAKLTKRQTEELLWYNALDVGATIHLFHTIMDEAKELDLVHVYDHDRALICETLEWTRRGICVDMKRRRELIELYREEVDEYKEVLLKECMLEDPDVAGNQILLLEAENNKDHARIVALRNCCFECPKKDRKAYKSPGQLIAHVKKIHSDVAGEYLWERAEAIAHHAAKIKERREKIKELQKQPNNETFNPGSPLQLRDVLARRGVRPKKLTKTGLISTSKGALWDYRDDVFVDTLFRWREKTKLLSTYLVNLPKRLGPDGAIHPVWKLHATPSGRFGTQPAVQNWPKEMKKMMIARPGHKIVGADYSALELRISALLSGQQDLIDAFNNDEDIHARHAARFFPKEWNASEGDVEARESLRSKGKPVTFGKIYRAGDQTLYEQIREQRKDVKTKKEHSLLFRETSHMSRVLDRMYPNVVKSAELFTVKANAQQFLKTHLLGRIRRWPQITQKHQVSPNEACNHPIQGLAADIMNRATLKLSDALEDRGWYGTKAWIILQIHDALYIECRKEIAEQVRELLEECMACEITLVSHVTKEEHTMRFPAQAKIADNVKDAA